MSDFPKPVSYLEVWYPVVHWSGEVSQVVILNKVPHLFPNAPFSHLCNNIEICHTDLPV